MVLWHTTEAGESRALAIVCTDSAEDDDGEFDGDKLLSFSGRLDALLAAAEVQHQKLTPPKELSIFSRPLSPSRKQTLVTINYVACRSVENTPPNVRAYARGAQSKAGKELSDSDIMHINKSQTVGPSFSRQTKSREIIIQQSLPTTKQRRDLLAMARSSQVSDSKSSVHGLLGTGGLLDLATRTRSPAPHQHPRHLPVERRPYRVLPAIATKVQTSKPPSNAKHPQRSAKPRHRSPLSRSSSRLY